MQIWPSGKSSELAIQRSLVQVPPGPLAGFVHGSLEFKSSTMLVNSLAADLPPASCDSYPC